MSCCGATIINGLIHYPRFDTLGSMRRFTVNLKTQIFFTAGVDSVVVCNLIDAIGIVAFNDFKLVVVDVA